VMPAGSTLSAILPARISATVTTISAAGRVVVIGARGSLEKLKASAKFVAGIGEVLEEFDFAIEMDEEGLVFVGTEHFGKETVGGVAFAIEDAALAERSVDKKADGERKITFLGEVGDGLRAAVFVEFEIVFIEGVDDFPFFVANGRVESDFFDVDGDFGSFGLR